MDRREHLSLRRTEISLKNFNNVAIPHHLDLLAKHKDNIYKFHKSGDMTRVKSEQINATRVIIQLKHLMEEMDVLRHQVKESDVAKFDQMTETSRKNTIQAIKEYIDLSQFSNKRLSSCEQSPMESYEDYDAQQHGDLQEFKSNDSLELNELQLKARQSCLKSWEILNEEIQDIHELFIKCEQVINAQAEPINIIEGNIETANENVSIGRSFLKTAETYKTKWYPLGGAFLGGCLAGPIGLLAGFKLGGIAILGGAALGFTGGNILKKKQNYVGNIPQSTNEVSNKKDD